MALCHPMDIHRQVLPIIFARKVHMHVHTISIFVAIIWFFISSPRISEAVYLTRENWDSVPHPVVVSFSRDTYGNWTGITKDGRIFRQYAIENQYGIRIERFEIDGYHHFVVEGEIMYSLSDLSRSLVHAHNRSLDHT
jgi:hypothetical protein